MPQEGCLENWKELQILRWLGSRKSNSPTSELYTLVQGILWAILVLIYSLAILIVFMETLWEGWRSYNVINNYSRWLIIDVQPVFFFSLLSESLSCIHFYSSAFSMSVFLPCLPDCHDYDFLSVLNATI